jgi:MFS family permease
MRPLLALVAVTAAAESGVALLLLLHLQRGHGLELGEIAAVFLPGFIVYTVVPEYLHGFVRRFGRTSMLAVAMTSSAGFAVALSFAPNPVVIAGLWILSAVAYAAAIPIEQGVVAEAAGLSLGRGMGIYESATLLGATVGAIGAGVLYGTGETGWRIACLAAGGVLLGAALLVRPALRAVGVPDRPPSPPEPPTPADGGPAAGLQEAGILEARGHRPESEPHQASRSAPPSAETSSTSAADAPVPSGPADEIAPAGTTADLRAQNRTAITRWSQHVGLFVLGQVVLMLIGESWLLETVRSGGAGRRRLVELGLRQQPRHRQPAVELGPDLVLRPAGRHRVDLGGRGPAQQSGPARPSSRPLHRLGSPLRICRRCGAVRRSIRTGRRAHVRPGYARPPEDDIPAVVM